jgi:hypothetical protein
MFPMIPTINRDYFPEQLYQADLCNGGQCVFCTVCSGFLNIIYINSRLQGVNIYPTLDIVLWPLSHLTLRQSVNAARPELPSTNVWHTSPSFLISYWVLPHTCGRHLAFVTSCSAYKLPFTVDTFLDSTCTSSEVERLWIQALLCWLWTARRHFLSFSKGIGRFVSPS